MIGLLLISFTIRFGGQSFYARKLLDPGFKFSHFFEIGIYFSMFGDYGFVMNQNLFCRHCLVHCHLRITRKDCWCYEVIGAISIGKLHRSVFPCSMLDLN